MGAPGAGALATALGAAAGLTGGLAHTLFLRRALERQAAGLAAQLSEIGGRVLREQTTALALPFPVPRQRLTSEALESAGALGAGSPPGARVAVPVGAMGRGPVERMEQVVAQLLSIARCAYDCGSLIEAPGDVVVVLARDGRVASCSDASSAVLGWAAGELRGRVAGDLVHPADLTAFTGFVDEVRARRTDPTTRTRARLRTAHGKWRVLEWAGSPSGEPSLVVLAGRDVTDHAQMEADLLHQATHDTLTGLPNRTALMRLAADAVETATAEQPLSVLMIDLDRFKDVNDSLGHAIGDKLLSQVGPRLRSALRPHDTIARLGGDEFAVLLPMAGEDGARGVAERLAETLDSPFVVEGMDLHVEASIGMAVSHRHDRAETGTIEGLLREADIAMYRAKEEGAAIVLFEPEHDSGHGRSRLELTAELRRGISEGQLVLHYQPVVDVVEGRLAGVEALVRWNHPERGLVSPGTFLPLAEQTGLIIPLSKFVLASAVAQAAAWASADCPVQIAVNLSPRWLQHADVPEIVSGMLALHELPSDLLRLEITESVVLAQPQHALVVLNELRGMGIGLSLDDFGTGYSSMTHLRNLPVDELKVDRGFVDAMTTSPQDAVIVRAAIELGHNLGMNVVAEGIEDADTLAEVVASGCSLAQGYYFAKPLPAAHLVAWALDRFPQFGHGERAARRPRDS